MMELRRALPAFNEQAALPVYHIIVLPHYHIVHCLHPCILAYLHTFPVLPKLRFE